MHHIRNENTHLLYISKGGVRDSEAELICF